MFCSNLECEAILSLSLSLSFLPKSPPQYLVSPINQTSPPSSSMADTHAANPTKSLLLTHFVHKAFLVTIFLVLVPLFPSLAPDFVNHRSWELLQLVFVGIAVSYGLFSKKNDEPLKEKDHAHSYVSKLLQVSSVFDDESETLVEDDNTTLNSSQYYRGQPPVVVVPKPETDDGVVSEIRQKPLRLPVRSLKPDLGLADNGKTKVEGENVVVLPSPIPWRSRSGRMQMDESRSFSPTNLSPSPSTSVSPVRKKGLAAPPPPPPPPPPQIQQKSKEVVRRNVSSASEVVRKVGENDGDREEEKNDKVLVEEDSDSEAEAEIEEDEGGRDVDKKADEFIAKFREQIRQQRIESIRKSAALRTTANKLPSSK